MSNLKDKAFTETDEDVLEFLDDEIQEIMELLSEIPPVPVPKEFDLRFKRALKEEIKKQKQKKLMKGLSALAAGLLICVVSYSVLEGGFNPFPDDLAYPDAGGRIADKEALTENDSILFMDVEMSDEDDVFEDAEQDKSKIGAEEQAPAESEVYGYSDSGPMSRSDAVPGSEDESYGDYPAVSNYSVVIGGNDNYDAAPDLFLYSQKMPEGFLESAAELDQADAPMMAGSGSAGGGGGAAAPSRGTYFTSTEEFNTDCQRKIQDIVKAIADQSGDALADVLAVTSEEGYSSSKARTAIELYRGLFGGQTPVYSGVSTSGSLSSKVQFDVSANGNSVRFTMTATESGVKVTEPVLDQALWLSGQMKNTVYVLEGYQVNADGSIQFQVRVLEENQEQIDEVRYIVWNKTES